ncbi:general stress protein [Oceanobacillus piezotolerans]|uniref:General stress protein n=1 Tax=Oceanobacillus piezotolerans TaxID=2448030 RepID=A0A498DFK7_9BACI|nr:pyridoxamine 5'-phosphate oxidase family protein [Oceanobacillus piezotolerans]RLL46721.1 general stress protein [Oceanobacillus piezotolerans]
MEQQEVRKHIEQIITESSTGIMATVKGNKPHSRYMTFFNEDLTLYTPTSRDTDKTEEISENPNTHILLGYDGEGFGDSYVEYEGKVTIKEDEELKKKIWDDNMKIWFDGPEDPDLIVLEIKPNQIRLMNKKGTPPETLEL